MEPIYSLRHTLANVLAKLPKPTTSFTPQSSSYSNPAYLSNQQSAFGGPVYINDAGSIPSGIFPTINYVFFLFF